MIAFRFLHRALRGVGERKKSLHTREKSLFIYLSGIIRYLSPPLIQPSAGHDADDDLPVLRSLHRAQRA
jgi:hypothetical protein